MIALVIKPSKLPALIKGTSTYQTASMRICHLPMTFYKCNDTFSLRGSFFEFANNFTLLWRIWLPAAPVVHVALHYKGMPCMVSAVCLSIDRIGHRTVSQVKPAISIPTDHILYFLEQFIKKLRFTCAQIITQNMVIAYLLTGYNGTNME